MKKIVVTMITLLIMTGTAARNSDAGQFDSVITTADVEKITGLTGVKSAPRDQTNKFRNGDLNFVMNSGQPILMIEFRPSFVFDAMKEDSGYYKTPVQGIGDEAFTSPAFDPQFSVNFKKGRYVAVVTTHIDPKDKKKTVLRLEDLISLAKLAANRM